MDHAFISIAFQIGLNICVNKEKCLEKRYFMTLTKDMYQGLKLCINKVKYDITNLYYSMQSQKI